MASALLLQAQAQLDTILANIMELVRVETFSYDKPALDRGADVVIGLVEGHLGHPDFFHRFDGGKQGDCLHFVYEGNADKAVMFLGHYDTVWPLGTLADWDTESGQDEDGNTFISAPGIHDMKGGLVQAIWAAKLAREYGTDVPTIHLLINGDEEIGSLASRGHIEDVARLADAAFCFEATHHGKVKIGRKGVGVIKVEATGIESHAGVNPEDGASAITAVIDYCTAVAAQARPEAGTTVNIGLINGGSSSNVIPGHATAQLDIRITSAAEMQRMDQVLDTTEWSDPRVQVAVHKDWNRPPLEFTPANQWLYSVMEERSRELGWDLEATAVGGASDANFVSALGTPVMCGVGTVGTGAHARHEAIYPTAIPHYIALVAETVLAIPHSSRA